jgi:hypothetical protein
MSKRTIVFCLGVFVALLPFLGFPQSWDTLLFVSAGILLSTIVWIPVRHSSFHYKQDEMTPETDPNPIFAEHRPDEQSGGNVISAPPPQRTARIRTPRSVTTSHTSAIKPRKRPTKHTAAVSGEPAEQPVNPLDPPVS